VVHFSSTAGIKTRVAKSLRSVLHLNTTITVLITELTSSLRLFRIVIVELKGSSVVEIYIAELRTDDTMVRHTTDYSKDKVKLRGTSNINRTCLYIKKLY